VVALKVRRIWLDANRRHTKSHTQCRQFQNNVKELQSQYFFRMREYFQASCMVSSVGLLNRPTLRMKLVIRAATWRRVVNNVTRQGWVNDGCYTVRCGLVCWRSCAARMSCDVIVQESISHGSPPSSFCASLIKLDFFISPRRRRRTDGAARRCLVLAGLRPPHSRSLPPPTISLWWDWSRHAQHNRRREAGAFAPRNIMVYQQLICLTISLRMPRCVV